MSSTLWAALWGCKLRFFGGKSIYTLHQTNIGIEITLTLLMAKYIYSLQMVDGPFATSKYGRVECNSVLHCLYTTSSSGVWGKRCNLVLKASGVKAVCCKKQLCGVKGDPVKNRSLVWNQTVNTQVTSASILTHHVTMPRLESKEKTMSTPPLLLQPQTLL